MAKLDTCTVRVPIGSGGFRPAGFSSSLQNFSLTVHTMAMFCAGGGSLSRLLKADGFGFT